MKGNSPSILSFGLIVSAILGYFIYGTLEGVLAIILLFIITGAINILSIIPLIGWIASIVINWFIVIPRILSFTGIEMTWLVWGIFAYQVLLGFILTGVAIVWIISKVWEIK